MSLPTITLVTPSFNQAEFLERTIQSVLAQDYPALDWIIVDAVSSDGTLEILEKYRHTQFLRIIREPDRGQSDAINKGFRAGTGEIAGWLNSDDELLPGALHSVGRAFEANPEAIAAYGAGRKIDVSGGTLKRVPARPFDRNLLRTAFFVLQPSFFFKRKAVLDLGGIDESLHYAMDWDLALRLAARGEFVVVDEELSALRCYPGTKSETGGWKRFEELGMIGRRNNGILDRNFLALRARRLAASSAIARRGVDFLFSRLYPDRTIMVVGWPEDAK